MTEEQPKSVCGIVMPISAIDGCAESHWTDVLDIITEAVEESGFIANLVSNADDVGIIHKRIIQNLYDNPIVVCDVSGKNPNVMFELGMRLAFDKPTIIVKDDKTSYSFDTSAIEHIEYPRDLRFSKIIEFKEKLATKIKATHDRAATDKNYTTFLKHFGEFTVAKLQKKEVSGQEYILEELKSLRGAMQRMEYRTTSQNRRVHSARERGELSLCLGSLSKVAVEQAYEVVAKHPDVREVELHWRDPDHAHLLVTTVEPGKLSRSELEDLISAKVKARPRLRHRPAAEG
ncbi:hypothetical protein [Stenotrophomonas maltophilia]|uniref:hypothetical protein n=1 Tax=Stenotrophomonas maltophilia TaxID=40324 RepID=UPI00130FBEBB|nr:hypothetical protein [Stenotrophomonas maltophilia]